MTQREALVLAHIVLTRMQSWGGIYEQAAHAVQAALDQPDDALEQARADLKDAMQQVRTLLIHQQND